MSVSNFILKADFWRCNLYIRQARERESVELYLEPERVFHQRQRAAVLQYLIQQLQIEDSVDIIPTNKATTRPIRKVLVPLASNVTNNIYRLAAGGRFELKQNMVQLLRTRGKFTG